MADQVSVPPAQAGPVVVTLPAEIEVANAHLVEDDLMQRAVLALWSSRI